MGGASDEASWGSDEVLGCGDTAENDAEVVAAES
jgi:hypothetical protein